MLFSEGHLKKIPAHRATAFWPQNFVAKSVHTKHSFVFAPRSAARLPAAEYTLNIQRCSESGIQLKEKCSRPEGRSLDKPFGRLFSQLFLNRHIRRTGKKKTGNRMKGGSLKDKSFKRVLWLSPSERWRFCSAKPAPIPQERMLSLCESHGHKDGTKRNARRIYDGAGTGSRSNAEICRTQRGKEKRDHRRNAFGPIQG